MNEKEKEKRGFGDSGRRKAGGAQVGPTTMRFATTRCTTQHVLIIAESDEAPFLCSNMHAVLRTLESGEKEQCSNSACVCLT